MLMIKLQQLHGNKHLAQNWQYN